MSLIWMLLRLSHLKQQLSAVSLYPSNSALPIELMGYVDVFSSLINNITIVIVTRISKQLSKYLSHQHL